MSIYFLFENPKLKWRTVKKELPKTVGDVFFIPPLKRLNKKKLEFLSSRLQKDSLYFSFQGNFEEFFTFPEEKTRSFFYLSLAKCIRSLSEKLNFSSICLFGADNDTALLFLSEFSMLFLSGEGSERLSESLLNTVGAAVPVVSKAPKNSAGIFFGEGNSDFPGPAFYPDSTKGGKSFGIDNLGYVPQGQYGFISDRLQRPLSCYEAARLFNYDKKATFNILTNPVFRSII